jgi:AcrR family transcriptional regulator
MCAWQNAVSGRDEQRELKKLTLLRVAGRMFSQRGFHNVSLDDIAAALEVSKPALYYYFQSKEELLYECTKITYDCGQEALKHSEKHGGTSFEKFCLLQQKFIELLATDRGAYTSNGDMYSMREEWREELKERRRKFDTINRKLLQGAIDEGSIRNIDPKIASSYFLGAVNWMLRWYSESGNYKPTELGKIFLDLFINGILPGPQGGPGKPDKT